jgi:hypothetical protein
MIKIKDGRTIIPVSSERIGDIGHLPLDERVRIIFERSLTGDMQDFARKIKRVDYLSAEKGINVDLEDYPIGDGSEISSRLNMIVGKQQISLRSFFDGVVRHPILYDMLKMAGNLTGNYQLKDTPLSLGPKNMTEVIPATESPYFFDRAIRFHEMLYDPKNIDQTRKMVALRFTNQDQLQERAEELYSKMLVEFLGVNLSSQ